MTGVDTNDKPRKRSDLSTPILGELGGLRTEVQVKPHEGFAPGAIAMRDPIRLASEAMRATLQQARPPGWTGTPGVHCIPPAELAPDVAVKHMDQWDTGSEIEAEKLCGGCPVRAECLVDAMRREKGQNDAYRFMVRGGLTPKARFRLENQT